MSKYFNYDNVRLSGDIFIRELLSRHMQNSIILQLNLGPTPLKISNNPEEFTNEITITLNHGVPLRKLINVLIEIDTARKDIAAWHMPIN